MSRVSPRSSKANARRPRRVRPCRSWRSRTRSRSRHRCSGRSGTTPSWSPPRPPCADASPRRTPPPPASLPAPLPRPPVVRRNPSLVTPHRCIRRGHSEGCRQRAEDSQAHCGRCAAMSSGTRPAHRSALPTFLAVHRRDAGGDEQRGGTAIHQRISFPVESEFCEHTCAYDAHAAEVAVGRGPIASRSPGRVPPCAGGQGMGSLRTLCFDAVAGDERAEPWSFPCHVPGATDVTCCT